MNTAKFVVSHLDEQLGPYDEQELMAKWAKGEILPIDYVYDEAKQDWILLAERFVWAAQVQGEDVMPPPPATARTETVIARRLNAELAAKAPTVSAVTTPVEVTTPAAPVTTVSESYVEIEPTEVIKLNAETVQFTPPSPAKVKLTDGFGEVDLSPLYPGQVLLIAQDTGLPGNEPLQIKVKPAEPVEIVWTVANQQTVGQDLEIQLKALDEHGNICMAYADQFTLQLRGSTSKDIVVLTTDGQAHIRLHQEKAETWTVNLAYNGGKKLRLPEARKVEWLAGPAAKLVIDGPHEYTAGLPLKVKVRAVDTFGNVATQYQGTVVLEVKAS